jgi:hypothetical protein
MGAILADIAAGLGYSDLVPTPEESLLGNSRALRPARSLDLA